MEIARFIFNPSPGSTYWNGRRVPMRIFPYMITNRPIRKQTNCERAWIPAGSAKGGRRRVKLLSKVDFFFTPILIIIIKIIILICNLLHDRYCSFMECNIIYCIRILCTRKYYYYYYYLYNCMIYINLIKYIIYIYIYFTHKHTHIHTHTHPRVNDCITHLLNV